jgi:Fic family protein
MLSDKHSVDLKKLKHKYPDEFNDYLKTLKEGYYKELPLLDFNGNNTVFLSSCTNINLDAVKLLYTAQNDSYGISSVEDEIISTSSIESIDFSRDSVRSIMKGYAPKDEAENRIYGLKKGFEFISDKSNKITEENLYTLYTMTVGDFLDNECRLSPGHYYRHDEVFVVGSDIEHTGIDHKKLGKYMKSFIDFANATDDINDLVKASMLHFYIAYLHPYFDGNGRMARLVHMWFLVQCGYETTLFVPLSSYIERSRKKYYNAFSLVEENCKFSGVIDLTPFLVYYNENVYNRITEKQVAVDVLEKYKDLLDGGEITAKEAELWQFVLSFYAGNSFTTKQLEKDFGNAAYATIRSFVLKFTDYGLLKATQMKNKVFYRIA